MEETEIALEQPENNIDEQKKEKRKVIITNIIVCAVILATLWCLSTFVIRPVRVSGSSMLDTYKNNDLVLCNVIGYQLSGKKLNRGDVVIINETETARPLIKRVIAVEGDEIDIDFETGDVRINGEILQEDYIKEKTYTDLGAYQYPITVDEGCYFVMGDNRNHSVDSRDPSVGFVPKDRIVGNVIYKFFIL